MPIMREFGNAMYEKKYLKSKEIGAYFIGN
jgi:hypothetical protein